ncbi:MAG TPA: hypothetical protein VNG33_15035 [Polyangiaceae bacterium]|nr:hypothetical protein [Polyangiaceae bacterium]
MTQVISRALSLLALLSGGLVALSCGSSSDGGGMPAGVSGDGSGGSRATSGSGGTNLELAGAATQDNGGNAGAGGAAPACPLYRSLCAGACIPTSADPSNCGACDKQCATGEVCSAGVCSSECAPGLTACAGACVDLATDSGSCGKCGKACPDGQGCSAGRCADSVAVGPTPKKCAGGGPPISVGDDPNKCLGTLAQTTFRWSLCSCTDLNVSAQLSTDAYDSAVGPYQPGELGGGVGVDRDVSNWSEAVTVGGTLWVAGTNDYSSSGPPSEVKADMHLAGSWKASTKFSVDGPAYVVGALSGVTVAGKTQTVKSVPAACDCAADKLVDIAGIVQAHQAPNNDNDAIALDPAVFESPGSALSLDLPCGNFYFTNILTSLATTIHVHGRTALYVEGDVSASSPLAFVLDPDAELDVFVAGTLKVSDTFIFGSPNYPALSRLYVGGTAKIALSADVRLAGELYAASSEQVVWSAKNAIYGSVFAGNFRASDVTDIHYDRAVLHAGDECPPGGGECGSCKDCHNQACKNGKCGECSADSDCCPPLECVEGSCRAITVVK